MNLLHKNNLYADLLGYMDLSEILKKLKMFLKWLLTNIFNDVKCAAHFDDNEVDAKAL